MTKAREWPNNAREALNLAAEEEQAVLTALRPLIERPPADPTASGCIVKVVFHTQNSLRHLEAVGAQTRPT